MASSPVGERRFIQNEELELAEVRAPGQEPGEPLSIGSRARVPAKIEVRHSGNDWRGQQIATARGADVAVREHETGKACQRTGPRQGRSAGIPHSSRLDAERLQSGILGTG